MADKAFCNKCGFYGEPQDGGFHYRPKDGVACNYSAFASPKSEPVETQPEASRSPVSEERQMLANIAADAIVMDVAELPDRTSPDDWPEAMLVTEDELREIVLRNIASLAALSNTQPQAPSEEKAREVLAEVSGCSPSVVKLLMDPGSGFRPSFASDVIIRAMIRFATDTQPVAGGGQ